jgi:hypothetical protein
LIRTSELPMFEIHPPDYPLNREAFVAALASGHGRAMIHACMHCRSPAVELMIRQDECPPWVAEECAFDAYEGLRKRVAGKPESCE